MTETQVRSAVRDLSQIGAVPTETGVFFRVWAPNARQKVEVQIEPSGERYPLNRETNGSWAAIISGLGAGTRYKFALDDGDAYPDPCSRSQPEGVHGPSEVVAPTSYVWTDADWPGLQPDGLVIYECHVGTMTPEGTFAALEGQLSALKDLGVTAIEMMPVAQWPGDRNWGYDGVALWAPANAYGRPDDLRRFVDAAHAQGLGVLLDVVYNHLGPDGNYLRVYANEYFTDRHHTPWGDAINYDGPGSRAVRDFVIGNALHWQREYHIDGFRLDATHAILDDSPIHIVAELTQQLRDDAQPHYPVVIAEDGRNDVNVIHPSEAGGWGCDGMWADDFHHELHVYLTGEHDGYYASYEGTPDRIANVIVEGLTYQGQVDPFMGEPRGTRVTDEPARSFVFCLQNHDQVGNRALGERLSHHIAEDQYHVAATLFLLAPETPLIFMGDEFRASSPFLYFTDHNDELGRLVTEGRRQEFAHFAAFQDETARERIPDPQAEQTFLASKLDVAEREEHGDTFALYRELLRLRREDPVLKIADRYRTAARAFGDVVVTRRWTDEAARLVIANFGNREAAIALRDIHESALFGAAPELLFDSGHLRYGGSRATVLDGGHVRVPAHAAAVLAL